MTEAVPREMGELARSGERAAGAGDHLPRRGPSARASLAVSEDGGACLPAGKQVMDEAGRCVHVRVGRSVGQVE